MFPIILIYYLVHSFSVVNSEMSEKELRVSKIKEGTVIVSDNPFTVSAII